MYIKYSLYIYQSLKLLQMLFIRYLDKDLYM